MNLEDWLNAYGIWAILVASCFEGEMVSVLSGIGSRAGHLPWPWVIFVSWLGTFSATQAWFFAGRYAGEQILQRKPHLGPKRERATQMIDKWGIAVFIFYRYLYGLRTVTPFAIGMTGIAPIKFVVIDGLCWFLWLGTLASLGYAFGDIALGYLDVIVQYQQWFLGLLLLLITGAAFRYLIRKK